MKSNGKKKRRIRKPVVAVADRDLRHIVSMTPHFDKSLRSEGERAKLLNPQISSHIHLMEDFLASQSKKIGSLVEEFARVFSRSFVVWVLGEILTYESRKQTTSQRKEDDLKDIILIQKLLKKSTRIDQMYFNFYPSEPHDTASSVLMKIKKCFEDKGADELPSLGYALLQRAFENAGLPKKQLAIQLTEILSLPGGNITQQIDSIDQRIRKSKKVFGKHIDVFFPNKKKPKN